MMNIHWCDAQNPLPCISHMSLNLLYLIKDFTAASISDSFKPSKLFLTSLPFSNLAVTLGGTPNASLIKMGNL